MLRGHFIKSLQYTCIYIYAFNCMHVNWWNSKNKYIELYYSKHVSLLNAIMIGILYAIPLPCILLNHHCSWGPCQCSWLSWVILAHEFTSPRTYIQSSILHLIKLSRLLYQQNYVHTNQENFGFLRTLTPTNKNASFSNKLCHHLLQFHWISISCIR